MFILESFFFSYLSDNGFVADGLKLIIKEAVLPSTANKGLFIGAPIIVLSLSFIGWAVIPFGKGIVLSDIKLGILYILAISSLSVYGVIFSGWSSNNKYSLLGGLRSTAQMLSYELVLTLVILNVLFCSGSYNLSIITEAQNVWYIIPLFPIGIMFYIITLAELQRPPFDLLESESEIIAGFMTEYSSLLFSFFFLAEYGNMILMSTINCILFLGGFGETIGFSLGFKVSILLYSLIWVRAAFPRYRYELLIGLCWKKLLPLAIGFTLFIGGLLVGFDWCN